MMLQFVSGDVVVIVDGTHSDEKHRIMVRYAYTE